MAVLTGSRAPASYASRSGAAASGARMSTWFAGVLALLVGAWGAIVPFVGPEFHYSADGTGAWAWSAPHAWLFLVPGAVAVLGALLIMAVRGGIASLGALLAIVAGAWFVIGPVAWPVIHGSTFFSGDTTLRQFEFWVGYSLGPGVLLAILGAFVLGRPKSVGTPVTSSAAEPSVVE